MTIRARSTLFAAPWLALGLAACSSSGGSIGTVEHLTQPATVQQVAAQLHATGLKTCGSSPMAGVVDSGVAYQGRERIGIDTFAGPSQRDKWKRETADFGVSPFEQGPTWVTYKAVDQTAKGCP